VYDHQLNSREGPKRKEKKGSISDEKETGKENERKFHSLCNSGGGKDNFA